MHKDLVDILVCPTCKEPLRLTTAKQEGDDVVEGSLECAKSGEVYPIEDSIPNLLPPSLRT